MHPGNILVKRLKDGSAIPVLFDYKRIGNRTYPFQFLITTKRMGQKLLRRYQRLKTRFNPMGLSSHRYHSEQQKIYALAA